jgi:hypothetical protein
MRNRLISKARADRAQAITDRLFQRCESRQFQNCQKAETVEEFLERGGKINKIDESRKL